MSSQISIIREKIEKANKMIGVIDRLKNILPRQSLITIYKSFAMPQPNDQPITETFCNLIEKAQYCSARSYRCN